MSTERTMERPKRHRFGITDRLHNPACVRWVNILSVGPAMAAFEAETKNQGWVAHEAYLKEPAEHGMGVWRVELWPNE